MQKSSMPAIAFVVRCAGAATIAYELATWLGLPQALWAAMSALIVSQDNLNATQSSFRGRIAGTLLGIGVALIVGESAVHVKVPLEFQITVAVAICALAARSFPTLRVAMWTCPIILLSGHSATPLLTVAFRRGCEVILGALVGWILHWVADRLDDSCVRLRARRSATKRASHS